MQYLKAKLSARTFEKRIERLGLTVVWALLVLALLTFAEGLVWRLRSDSSRNAMPETEVFQPTRRLPM
jgi:hypothetical protein